MNLQFSELLREKIEEALRANMPQAHTRLATRLNQAIEYTLFPGGKRLRPVLCLLSTGAAAGQVRMLDSLPEACAIEFLHASSMVFDDLPCMDDAQMRRGKPAVHVEFGEHFALLAGIALLNRAYELLGSSPALIAEAARCVGVDGMVGGQAIDLGGNSSDFSADDLQERNSKTSALIRLAMTAGAISQGVSRERIEALGLAGDCIGRAYQVFDDLLDHLKTGKTPGQDARHGRPSHASQDQSAVAAREAESLVKRAKSSIVSAFEETQGVQQLIGFIDLIFDTARQQQQQPGS